MTWAPSHISMALSPTFMYLYELILGRGGECEVALTVGRRAVKHIQKSSRGVKRIVVQIVICLIIGFLRHETTTDFGKQLAYTHYVL